MDKESYLKDIRKERKESVDFFAASRDKFICERWVVDEFLKNLTIPFTKQELNRGSDPPDVIFRDARFEVKEILDEGRKRHDEYKQALIRSEAATDPAELLEQYSPKDISIQEIFTRIYSEADKLATKTYKSSEVRGQLDLLFYVNLQDVSRIIETPFPDVTQLKLLGYRSVSFLNGHRNCILCYERSAPSFLQVPPIIIYRAVP
jgi:hypothetical protein